MTKQTQKSNDIVERLRKRVADPPSVRSQVESICDRFAAANAEIGRTAKTNGLDTAWHYFGMAKEISSLKSELLAALSLPAPDAGWRYDMQNAPRDGTLLLLQVGTVEDYGAPLEDTAGPSRTVGFNNLDNDENDEWCMSGWNWENDYFTKGRGEPVAWMLFPDMNPPAKEALMIDPWIGECNFCHARFSTRWELEEHEKECVENDKGPFRRKGPLTKVI